MSDAITKAIAAAVGGAVIGWSANSLTFAPRIAAVEAALNRVEHRLDVLIDQPRKEK